MDQLANDLLDQLPPLGRIFQHPLFGKLRRRPMRNDRFLRRRQQLIDPQEQSLAEPGPQAFRGRASS